MTEDLNINASLLKRLFIRPKISVIVIGPKVMQLLKIHVSYIEVSGRKDFFFPKLKQNV